MNETTANVRQFKLGEVVRLASGSPDMTVIGVGEGDIRCQWYSEPAGRFEHYDFTPEALVDGLRQPNRSL